MVYLRRKAGDVISKELVRDSKQSFSAIWEEHSEFQLVFKEKHVIR